MPSIGNFSNNESNGSNQFSNNNNSNNNSNNNNKKQPNKKQSKNNQSNNNQNNQRFLPQEYNNHNIARFEEFCNECKSCKQKGNNSCFFCELCQRGKNRGIITGGRRRKTHRKMRKYRKTRKN